MLTELRKKIEDHTVSLGVIGLGYVGLPVACMMAKSGFQTTGIDLDAERVATVNNDENPIKGIELGLAELITEIVEAGSPHCTTDYQDLVNCDVVLISVQTPIEDDDHRPRYAHMKSALTSLGAVLKKGALVIIESTLAPGTMRDVIIPTLEEATGGTLDTDFYAGHCPERVTPGRLLCNLVEMSRSAGGSNPDVAVVMASLYANYVTGDLDETDMLTAELVKTAENAYRDVQIAFANELARVCQAIGGDVWRVRELVNKSPGRNMLLPGAGVGGHCIPKDPWLLIANAQGATTELIPAARHVNRDMPQFIKQLLVDAFAHSDTALGDATIAVLGYAYMENSDDTRDTPTQAFLDLIEHEVAETRIQDPFVDGYKADITETIAGVDAIVLMVKHADYYNTDVDAGGKIAERYNTVWGDKLTALLDEHQPDLVSVAVPTIYHYPIAKETLSRGIHTLIEKPIANTEEGRDLIALAEANNAFLTVGHIERFNPAIVELKRRLQAGEIGEVFRVQARRMSPFPSRIRDVGVTIDLATHDINITRYILEDDVVRVSAEIASVLTEHDDLIDAVLGFKNGVRATLNISRVTPTKIRELSVTDGKGMYSVNYLTQELEFYQNADAPSTWDSLRNLRGVGEGDMLRVAIPKHEPLYAELAHFVESVRDNTPPLVSGEDGLKALIVAQAILQSGRNNTLVNLDG